MQVQENYPNPKTQAQKPIQPQKKAKVELPPIPEKRYFKISEVGDLCALEAHVLRYWEQEFSQLKPLKRRGNRRCYQRDDILLIRRIRRLLYEEGLTIAGAKAKLAGKKKEPLDSYQVSACIRETVIKLEGVLKKLKATTVTTSSNSGDISS